MNSPLLQRRDARPIADETLLDVLRGLAAPQKRLPSKLFYDARGSELFEAICRQPEYYPTDTERRIMRRHASEIARRLGPRIALIELGSGSSDKTRALLDALDAPALYCPVDISEHALRGSARRLREAYPDLCVAPVVGDFCARWPLPAAAARAARRVIYFPGSTLGNFEPDGVSLMLARMRELAGAGGAILVGVDLEKDAATLEAAYNDAQGVTAAFNLNILRHLNHRFEAEFDLDGFEHRAFYNAGEHRIEMHLVSLRAQQVEIAGWPYRFAAGETICTEHSYKFEPARFKRCAAREGLRLAQSWFDPARWFGVFLFEPLAPAG